MLILLDEAKSPSRRPSASPTKRIIPSWRALRDLRAITQSPGITPADLQPVALQFPEILGCSRSATRKRMSETRTVKS
jgi:hypothetical protein